MTIIMTLLLLSFLLIINTNIGALAATPSVVLHGGTYQSTRAACLVPNRFTAACSCPSTYAAACFDAILYQNTTVDASTTINPGAMQSAPPVNSTFCVCQRSAGLSGTVAVYGGAYQQDDSTPCTAGCRYPNSYTGSCSCPPTFEPTYLRSLVFGYPDTSSGSCSSSIIGSHIGVCLRKATAAAVGTIANDASTFSLASQPITVPVINNFHGIYSLSTAKQSCLLGNVLPVRSSRYLTSINAATCNCPDNACATSFFWLTDELGDPFQYQRVAVCESSMMLPVDPSTLKNKLMFGYQQWHATSKNSFNTGWRHWSTADPLEKSLLEDASFDVWPDTSEFPSSNLSSAVLARPDGSITTLYDAYLPQTTQLHLQWLQYYGLDGMWLQRFCSELGDVRLLNARTTGLQQLRQYSEQYGRVFGVMWDVSGMDSTNLYAVLQTDVTLLQDQIGIFSSPAYIRHSNKALVTIWGFGIRKEIDTTTALSCVQLLKNAGFAVMGGVQFDWRTKLGANGENFSSVYNEFDIITPWTVGVYSSSDQFLSFAPAIQMADATYCAERGISYAPVVFPGSSWTNLQKHVKEYPLNEVPRMGGLFWQTQADSLGLSVMQQSSFSHLYSAMFDEFDEGTAMAKAAESYLDKPAQGSFLSYDADGYNVPNDHYLCLASRQSYRQQQPLLIDFPYSFRSS